jgi:hypothetical protein
LLRQLADRQDDAFGELCAFFSNRFRVDDSGHKVGNGRWGNSWRIGLKFADYTADSGFPNSQFTNYPIT